MPTFPYGKAERSFTEHFNLQLCIASLCNSLRSFNQRSDDNVCKITMRRENENRRPWSNCPAYSPAREAKAVISCVFPVYRGDENGVNMK